MADPAQTESRVAPTTLIVGLFVCVLVGRFTLDRVGFDQLGELDLRLVGCVVLVLATVLWRLHPVWLGTSERFVPSACAALALFALEAFSALWAPAGARLDERLIDIGVLAVVVVLAIVLTAADPRRAQRCLLWSAAVSGVVYSLGGLLVGEVDPQGRTVFLGGGPNVYVRVVCVGVIALIALAVIYRRPWLALVVPLLAVSAVLSGSRGGLLAAVFTAALFVVVFHRRLSPRLVLLAGVITVVAAWSFVASGGAVDVVERFRDVLTGRDLSERPTLFAEAWSIFLRNPVLGGGLDSFYISYGQNVAIDYSHNLLLDVASTVGAVGVALLLLAAVLWAHELRSIRDLRPEQIALAVAAAYIFIGSMTSGDFYDSRFMWVFAVVAVTPRAIAPLQRQRRTELVS